MRTNNISPEYIGIVKVIYLLIGGALSMG